MAGLTHLLGDTRKIPMTALPRPAISAVAEVYLLRCGKMFRAGSGKNCQYGG